MADKTKLNLLSIHVSNADNRSDVEAIVVGQISVLHAYGGTTILQSGGIAVSRSGRASLQTDYALVVSDRHGHSDVGDSSTSDFIAKPEGLGSHILGARTVDKVSQKLSTNEVFMHEASSHTVDLIERQRSERAVCTYTSICHSCFPPLLNCSAHHGLRREKTSLYI